MKNSIKREQSQAGLSFAERKNFRPKVKQLRLLSLLVLLMTAASGAWAQDAKHLITATYGKQTRSLEQPLPYATTIGEFYEAVTGQSFSDLISTMSALEMPLSGITSNNTDVVSIGELNGASTPVTVTADGKATVALRFGNYTQGIFVNAVSPLYVTMKDGVKDADKWTASTDGTNFGALPIGGLKGDGSETVTLKYNGRLKVKSVKATSDAAPAVTYTMASEATAADYGKVVCDKGHLHDAKTAVPTGCTAVAVFAYMDGGNNRYGIALQNAATQANWNTITNNGANKNKLCNVPGTWTVTAPTDASWFVATKAIYEAMFINLGSTTSDSDGTTYDGNVNAFITTGVGGTALDNYYWSTTEKNSNDGWCFSSTYWDYYGKSDQDWKVRPVLVW